MCRVNFTNPGKFVIKSTGAVVMGTLSMPRERSVGEQAHIASWFCHTRIALINHLPPLSRLNQIPPSQLQCHCPVHEPPPPDWIDYVLTWCPNQSLSAGKTMTESLPTNHTIHRWGVVGSATELGRGGGRTRWMVSSYTFAVHRALTNGQYSPQSQAV